MKILFDATVFEIPFTGVAKSTLCLYEYCIKMDPNLDVCGFIRNKTYSKLPDNIKLHKLNKKVFEKTYSQSTIYRILDTYKPDILHFPWNGNIPLKFKGGMTVMTLHDVLPLEIPYYFVSTNQKTNYLKSLQQDIDNCDVIFTDSMYSKRQIENNFRVRSEIIVNYWAPTLSKNQSFIQKKPEFQYFIYVGGYASRKGLDSLIKAFFSLYESKKTKCKLLFTGTPLFISNDFKELIEKGKKLGIIEERGYLSDDELIFLISNSVALIYLSKHEGFGLPPLEAMNLGCPVITTRYSSIPEVCGDSAIYVEPNDIDEVATKMLLLENSADIREEFRCKGLLQASSFSWEKTAETFLNHISK